MIIITIITTIIIIIVILFYFAKLYIWGCTIHGSTCKGVMDGANLG